MQTVTVWIEDDASVTYLDSPVTRGFDAGFETGFDLKCSVKRRYSRVEPVSRPLRVAFYGLRWAFGETGRVSEYTRGWRCLWRAKIVNGPTLAGEWRDRQEAINAEHEYFDTYGVQR